MTALAPNQSHRRRLLFIEGSFALRCRPPNYPKHLGKSSNAANPAGSEVNRFARGSQAGDLCRLCREALVVDIALVAPAVPALAPGAERPGPGARDRGLARARSETTTHTHGFSPLPNPQHLAPAFSPVWLNTIVVEPRWLPWMRHPRHRRLRETNPLPPRTGVTEHVLSFGPARHSGRV